MKLKKEVKRALVVIALIIAVVIIIKLVQSIDTTSKDLQKIGYSQTDASNIIEILSDELVAEILVTEYKPYIIDIITNPYYIPNNYYEYLNLYESNNQDISDVISIINTNRDNEFYTSLIKTNESDSMLVNKYYYLDSNFIVNDLVNVPLTYAYGDQMIRSDVLNAFIKMWNDAKKEELALIINSSYRTYQEQTELYNNSSDEYAARPGHSEHETSLALDIVTYNTIGNDFVNTDEYKWLVDNSYKYGFILRYPEGSEDITGYSFESWHYRYLGVELATKVYESKLTYDEYYAYFCEYKQEC